MADQQLACRDCGASFTFSDGEQAFYQERGLAAPQRCKDCRNKRKNERMGGRQMFPATCGKCGSPCEVPFKPRAESEGGRPVLCLACFKAEKGNGPSPRRSGGGFSDGGAPSESDSYSSAA